MDHTLNPTNTEYIVSVCRDRCVTNTKYKNEQGWEDYFGNVTGYNYKLPYLKYNK